MYNRQQSEKRDCFHSSLLLLPPLLLLLSLLLLLLVFSLPSHTLHTTKFHVQTRLNRIEPVTQFSKEREIAPKKKREEMSNGVCASGYYRHTDTSSCCLNTPQIFVNGFYRLISFWRGLFIFYTHTHKRTHHYC